MAVNYILGFIRSVAAALINGALKRQARGMFLACARKEHPLWWNSRLNPTPPAGKFEFTLKDVMNEVRSRMGSSFSEKEALRIFVHLLDKWPGGVLVYNATYAISRARDMGFLDENYKPNKNALPVDEEHARQAELYRLGGSVAVSSYKEIVRGLK